MAAIARNLSNSAPSIDMRNLYLNPIGADIYFTFLDSKKRLPAHKILLAKSSCVFKTAFYGSMPIEDEMLIEDAAADGFEVFLQFFYLSDVVLTMEHVQTVMEMAHKFEFEPCLKICVRFLTSPGNLLPGELCLAYQLGVYFDLSELKDYCRRHICFAAHTEINTDGFLQCSWSTLNEIVRMPYIACSETFLLAACLNWARHACQQKQLDENDKQNLRDQLKDLIYEIRFKSIKWDELAEHIDATILYNEMELREIICIMTDKETIASNFTYAKRMNAYGYYWCEKTPIPYTDLTVEKLSGIGIGASTSITFMSSEAVLFGGFDCTVFNVWPSSIDPNIDINDNSIPKIETITVSHSELEEFDITEFTQKKNRIELDSFWEIIPNVKYTVKLKVANGSVKSFYNLKTRDRKHRYSGSIKVKLFNRVESPKYESELTVFKRLLFFSHLH